MRYLWVIALLISCLLQAQQKEDDFKVGLVLSGGGAKGLAHIGALKIIEESGVRIDYIGGTSMGAIVGGLYASGYTATQLDSIFDGLDFDKLIQDEIPRNSMTFYEKKEADTYAVTLPFDGFKVSFPSGLSKGQNVYNLFSKLTSHVNDVDDFSKLPIPFFCMATNIETGESVELNSGYLPQAISASGALPSLFSPVVIDETIFVDGGVTNNYPIDQLKAKGMDIIIGVDVQDSLRSREQLKSAFDVLVQINNYRTIEAMNQKREETDVYVNPNIEDYTVVSFDQGRSIINEGEEEARKFLDDMKSIAVRQEKVEREPVKFFKETKLFLTDVGIEGNENYTRAYVLGKLKLQTPDSISYDRLNEGINNLSATGNFQEINYRFVEDEEGGTSIQFDLLESNSRNLLRLGAHYDDLFRTAALINITRKRLLTNNDIASLDVGIGDNLRYNFNYYIDKGYYWSIGLNSRFSFFEKDVATGFVMPELLTGPNLPINEIQLKYGDLTNTVYVETIFRRIFLLGAGVEHKWLRYFSETIGIDENDNPRTIFENTNYFSTYGYLNFDSLDNSFFPKKGFFFQGDIHWYLFAEGDNTDFDQFAIAKARAGFAKSFTDNLTLILSTEGGLKIGDKSTKSLDFFLGGYGFMEINNIIPFYGYQGLSLRGDTYLKSTARLDYEFAKKNHITLSANIANVGDDLFETKEWINEIDYTGYALGYGLETFLGPVELIYSYSPELDDSEWYVSIGFRF